MKIALHTISYSGSWGQASLTLDEIVERSARLGFDGLMLAAKRPHASPLDFDSVARRNLRAKIESHGMTLSCLAGYTNFTADAEHAEVPHREMQIHYVTELCRLATDLGGNIVRIFTGYEHPALPYSRAWDLTVAAIRECASRAADVGAVLAVQNHHDLAVHSSACFQFIRAVDEPACQAAFDAWAPALQEDDLIAAAKLLAPVTAFTTIADYARIRRFQYQPELVNYVPRPDYIQAVPVGEGFINYHAFLQTLLDNGYTGPVAYEMCSPLRDGGTLETLDRYARQFVEFMSPWRTPLSGQCQT